MRRVAFACVGMLTGALVFAHAQQQPVYVGGVSLVSVDVSVVDRDGHPVPGLGAEDFEIKLDNKVRPVRALSYERLPDPEPAPAHAPAEPLKVREVNNAARPSDPRLFVVLIDDVSIGPSRGKGMFFAASRFIDALQPTDVVGMATSSGSFAVNPTRDHAAVAAAVRRSAGAFVDPRVAMLPTVDARTTTPMNASVGMQESLEVTWGNGGLEQQIVYRDCFDGKTPTQQELATSLCAEEVQRQIRTVGALARGQADAQLRSYLNVIDAMRPSPGVKSLVLISDGVALAARDQRTWFDTIAKAAASAGVQVSVLVQEPDLVSVGDRSAIEASVRRDDSQAMVAGIQTVADLTGGNFFRVIGTPDAAFTRVALASSGVYHLGVEMPTGAAPGDDYQLTARVKRNAVFVHANRHAVAPVMPTSQPAEAQLQDGVVHGALAYGVPLTLATVVRRGETADQIDLGANVEVPSAVDGPLTVMFGLVDSTGAVTVGRKMVAPSPDGSSYRVSFTLPVTQGRYQLRFAAADASGHVGSLGMGVRAEFSRLGPFLASDVLTSWAATDGKPEFLALEEVPMRAVTLQSFLELYPTGAPPSNTRVEWTLLAPDGQPIAAETVEPTASTDRLTASAVFPLTALRAGSYEVRANVYVDGVSIGATSTTIHKTDKTPMLMWRPFEHCRGLCATFFEPNRR